MYLERTHASAETVNRATEIRLLAERQMGEFLKQMPKNEGTRPSTEHGGSMKAPPSIPTLAEIGITKKQSATAQKLADIPAPEFRERIAIAKASDGKLSTAKVLELLSAGGTRWRCRPSTAPALALGSIAARLRTIPVWIEIRDRALGIVAGKFLKQKIDSRPCPLRALILRAASYFGDLLGGYSKSLEHDLLHRDTGNRFLVGNAQQWGERFDQRAGVGIVH